DRVSTAGYALGYLGGGILLALNLAWITSPATFGLPSGEGLDSNAATLPARLALLSVAVWWLVFSIPLFRRVPEPIPAVRTETASATGQLKLSLIRLRRTFAELRGYRNAFLML